MAGETDLSSMLATLTVDRRPGLYCYIPMVEELASEAEAMITEPEGRCLVVSVAAAAGNGFQPDFVAAWLTLRVHSSLEAVGLTAAVSHALTEVNIPCNVIAGLHHDHLLVPSDSAEAATVAIETIGRGEGRRR